MSDFCCIFYAVASGVLVALSMHDSAWNRILRTSPVWGSLRKLLAVRGRCTLGLVSVERAEPA